MTAVLARMPEISRALARGDQTKAYGILANTLGLGTGEAGKALLDLCLTEPTENLRRVPRSPFGVRLTARECDYVQSAIRGLTDQETARTLYVSENTVKATWQRILSRHGARNKTALVGAVLCAFVPDWRSLVG